MRYAMAAVALLIVTTLASDAVLGKEDLESPFDLVDGPLSKVGISIRIDSDIPKVNGLYADWKKAAVDAMKQQGVVAVDADRNMPAVQALRGSPLLIFDLYARKIGDSVVVWSIGCEFQESVTVTRTGASRLATIKRNVEVNVGIMGNDLWSEISLKCAAMSMLVASGCAD